MELGRSPFGHAFVEPAPASPPSPVSDPASAAGEGGLELLAPQALRHTSAPHTSAPHTHDVLTRQAARDITDWFRFEMSKREAGSRSGS
jgi:hypothetical protein